MVSARFLRGPVIALALACALAAAPLSTASAEEFVDPATGSAIEAMAVPGALSLTAGAQIQYLVLPVAAGVTPDRVIARVTKELPTTGTLRVIIGGRTVQTLDASLATTIDAAVEPSDVVDGVLAVGFSLDTTDAETDVLCGPPAGRDLTIDEVGLVTGGTPTAPTSIADFFSPAVTAIDVVVPTGADDALRAAGLAAVSSLASEYDAGTTIMLTEAGATRPSLTAAQGRVVEFVAGDGDVTTAITTSSDAPILTISGAEADLAAAGAALGSSYAGVATTATTTGLSQKVIPSSSLEHTLADFGSERVVLGNAGQAASYTTITQSSFGGPVSSVELALSGTHTAIPSSITATMNVYWNDFLVGSSVLGEDTAIDEKISVPTGVLEASNGLSVRLSAVQTSNGLCIGSQSLPIELFLDGTASTVTAERGESVAAGFDRFPQALGGRVTVAFGESAEGADAIRAAGALVASLQRVAAAPLALDVVSAADFVSSDLSGVLVGASPADAEALESPLRLAAFTTIAGNSADFSVDTGAPYAALEAFSTGGREVVLLGGFTPDGANPAVTSALQAGAGDYIAALDGGWAALSGNLMVNVEGASEPVQIDSNEITPQAEVKDDYSAIGLWLVIALLVIAVLILAGWLVRRRRKRAVAAYVDAQQRAAEPSAPNAD